jgi:hypothetical protein
VRIDHVIYGTADLDVAAVRIEAQLGLTTVAGGRHDGVGTHNRIVPLGTVVTGGARCAARRCPSAWSRARPVCWPSRSPGASCARDSGAARRQRGAAKAETKRSTSVATIAAVSGRWSLVNQSVSSPSVAPPSASAVSACSRSGM